MPAEIEQVYRYDRVNQIVELVSVDASGTGGGNGKSETPTLSADGMRVAFLSQADNLSLLLTFRTLNFKLR